MQKKRKARRDPLPENGNGVLKTIIEDACKRLGLMYGTRPMRGSLTVMSPRTDPYRLDTPMYHNYGYWLADQLARFYGPSKQAHWRGLFYAIIMSKTKIKKPDGTTFSNTEEDWVWLSEKAGKAARWLGYVPFDRIIDRRSDEPVIHRAEKIEPVGGELNDLDDVAFPDDITPYPGARGFDVRQAFSFVMFGEKSSLEEICLPWAKKHQVDLFLGTGEISDTHLHQIARDAVADGRPLVVFTVTDCDPSGWQMFISIDRKLQAMRDLLFPALCLEMVHVGLTPEQVREFALAEQPIKKGDKRAVAWEEAFGVKQTEIDALTTPEMTEQGILRQLLDNAIAPYIDPTLDRRVQRAKTKWYRDAGIAVDQQIDAEAVERVRSKVERLQQQVERVKDELRAACEDITLPEIVVLESNLDVGSLDESRQAIIKFDTDWVTATKILIARKQYLGDDDEE